MKHTIAGFVAVAALAVAPAHAAEGLWAASPAAQWARGSISVARPATEWWTAPTDGNLGLKPASYGAMARLADCSSATITF